MALVIADRVKETSTTEGVGTLTLSGSTFGSFQTFEDTIGNGNITYYCIENGVNFEIGVGTYSSVGNTLSRDTVLQSSNSDNKINLAGVSTVFCVVPAEKLLYTDENGQASIIETPLPLTRSDDGDYWQVYSTDFQTRVVSFFMSEGLDPEWRLGLKTTTTESTQPYYGYISGKDGFVELKGNTLVTLSIGDGVNEGLTFNHRLEEILKLTANNGTISVGTLLLSSDNTTSISNDSISQDVLSVDAGVGHLANLQTWNVGADEKASIDADGNFSNSGDIYTSDVYLDNIRFSDGSVQSTAALPSASGYLIDQNTSDIAQNASDIVAISGLLGSVGETFDNDLTVSLGGGKTFGRYEDGDTIPSSGLTPIDVITLAVTEPIDPSVSLSASPSTIETGTTAISNTLSFNYTINNPGATVASVSLEFRRGNTGAWTVLSTNTALTNYVHSFVNGSADQINYRYVVTDSQGSTATATRNVSFSYQVFYGPTSSVPTTSADVRALPSSRFLSAGNTFTLNTGSTEVNFSVAMPSTQSITQVIDLDALNANITAEYINNPFNVDDGGGTPVLYNVYTMTIAIPYSSDHRHQVTKG